MRVLLDGLLPRLLPDLPFKCVPHEGKSDLEYSIRNKLRAWREPGVRFAVVQDNDGKDCHALKDALQGFCEAAGRCRSRRRRACDRTGRRQYIAAATAQKRGKTELDIGAPGEILWTPEGRT